VSPSLASAAIRGANSKNWVACRIEYGFDEVRDDLRADECGTADDDNLHDDLPLSDDLGSSACDNRRMGGAVVASVEHPTPRSMRGTREAYQPRRPRVGLGAIPEYLAYPSRKRASTRRSGTSQMRATIT
jgi:hypothetical protein